MLRFSGRGPTVTRKTALVPDLNGITRTKRSAACAGFTLVELTIVVLIIGILFAIAIPRIRAQTDAATDNGLRQTLRVVRDAIDVYRAKNDGRWPGSSDGEGATFKSDVAPYIRSHFPVGPVGPPTGDDRVRMRSNGLPLNGTPNPPQAWTYDYTTGEFIYSYNGMSNDGTTKYDEF